MSRKEESPNPNLISGSHIKPSPPSCFRKGSSVPSCNYVINKKRRLSTIVGDGKKKGVDLYRQNDLHFMALQYYGVTPMGMRFFPDSIMESVNPEELPIPTEWLLLPEEIRKAGPQVLIKYYKQCCNSEGFDITDFPGVSSLTLIVPMEDLQSNTESYDLVKRLAELAIAKYNEKFNTGFADVKVHKANRRRSCCRGPCTYYITFSVWIDSGAAKTFQAQVVGEGVDTVVHLCREKPKHQLERDLPSSGLFKKLFTADELRRQRGKIMTEQAYRI